jgi:hypothetical protein
MKRKMNLTPKEVEIKDSIGDVYSAFVTGGYDTKGNMVTIQDALTNPDSHLTFTRAITEIIQETIEPTLIGHLLLNTLYTNDRGSTQVTIRTLGPLGEVDFDIPEHGEYPEIKPGRSQASLVTTNYCKSGCKIVITEEMLASSQWNIIELMIRDSTKALARWKEKKIFDLLTTVGNVVFDNASPATAEIGRTLGRDIYGVGNGSMTHPDLIDMYSSLLSKGYIPNVLLVNPMHWAMFAKDPLIREAGMIKGDISAWLASQVTPVNPYAKIRPWTQATRMGNFSRQEVTLAETELLSDTAPKIPGYSPLSGITVIPSHYMPLNSAANTADIVMLDTNNAGAVIVNEELMLDGWEDKERDLQKVKLREKYALALYDNGRAVAVAKNISLEPNEIINNPSVVIQDLQPISRK